MWSAVTRLVEAGQRLLADRIDLGRIEIQDALSRTLVQLGVLLGGIMLAICGWVGLMLALALWLSARVPLYVSLVAAGLATGVVGLLLIRVGAREPARSRGGPA